MIFRFIHNLYFGLIALIDLLDLIAAITLIITDHSAIFSCEGVSALFITSHGNY